MRRVSLVLAALVVVSCSSRPPKPQPSADWRPGKISSEKPPAPNLKDMFDVSCDANFQNSSNQTLTIVSAWSQPPGDQWTASFYPGQQIPPGGGIGSHTSTSVECEAGFKFQLPNGTSFDASFDNPWNRASTWGCDQVPGFQCQSTGNSHGQPLVVRFNLVNQ